MIGAKYHFLIAGASGLVGRALLNQLLLRTDVAKVTVLVRKPLSIVHPVLSQRSVDFDALQENDIPANVDAVFCCLGTTMANAGSKDAFRKVDYEYVVKLAVFTQRQNIAQFHVISASGANPRSWIFYSKVKGRMELELQKLSKIRSVYVYKPSMLLGARTEFRFGESLGKWIMLSLAWLLPKSVKAIYDSEVAAAMIQRATHPQKGYWNVSNAEMKGAAKA